MWAAFPTNFEAVINKAAEIARLRELDARKGDRPGTQYSLLVIITDGLIDDLDETKAA
jgi:hypothetical protein